MRSKVIAVHWHRCECHSGVNDSTVHVPAVSMTPLCISQWRQWHRFAVCSQIIFLHKKTVVFRIIHENVQQSWLHSGATNTDVNITEVSMTPMCMPKRCQWLHYECHNGNDTAVNQLCRFTPQIRSHIQKGFNTCIRGPRGSCWMNKNRGRKSRVRVPLSSYTLWSRSFAF
jgi:hypothetical protein